MDAWRTPQRWWRPSPSGARRSPDSRESPGPSRGSAGFRPLSLLPQARSLWELSRQLLQIPLREGTRAPSSRSEREVLSECPSPTRLFEPPSLGVQPPSAASRGRLAPQPAAEPEVRKRGGGSSGSECARARAVAAMTAAAPRAEGRRVGGAGGSTSGTRFPRFPSLAGTSGGGRREVVPCASGGTRGRSEPKEGAGTGLPAWG